MFWIYRAFDTTNNPIFETRVTADSEMVAYFEGLRQLADAMRADQLTGRRARDLVEPVAEMTRPVPVERGAA
jgi:hypothetical protein